MVVASALIFMAMRPGVDKKDSLEGAWSLRYGQHDFAMLFQDGYCMFTQYSLAGKKFVLSLGGPYTTANGKVKVKIQFNSADKSEVGQEREYEFTLKGDALTTRNSDGELTLTWKRADAGNQNLAGNWRITKRKQGNEMSDIPLRARRTLKLLTSTRFQWAAINIETGEFSGTGGGTYTFKDGKYTENIEFFSRDSSRVGMSLSFDGKLENGDWIHSGKSSKGDPIYEVWSRMKPAE